MALLVTLRQYFLLSPQPRALTTGRSYAPPGQSVDRLKVERDGHSSTRECAGPMMALLAVVVSHSECHRLMQDPLLARNTFKL